MAYRVRHLLNDGVQVSDDTTFSFTLPESGNLHALLLRARCTNGATGGRNTDIFDVVDNIRVVGNGDDRFFELQPEEIEKWYECMMGKPLELIVTEAASAVQEGNFPIMWGRQLYDSEFFLPLDRIRNPRLEVVYSPTIAADGGFTTGTTTFNIIAIWSPPSDRLNYQGTLITRTVKNFTSAASGDEETDIEITDPIRAIGVYAYEAAIADGVDITRIRLEANTGEFDLLAADWVDFLNFNRTKFGARIVHNARLFAQNDDTIDVRLSSITQFQLTNFFASDVTADTFVIASADAIAGDRLTLDTSIADVTEAAATHIADATDRAYFLSAEGLSPSYFGVVPYMYPDNRNGYLDPRSLDKLKLILTQGGAGADVRIALQYLKQVSLV